MNQQKRLDAKVLFAIVYLPVSLLTAVRLWAGAGLPLVVALILPALAVCWLVLSVRVARLHRKTTPRR